MKVKAKSDKANSEDSDTPVRQSRRIAQQKIKEEAERRHQEEVALRELKLIHKKGKVSNLCGQFYYTLFYEFVGLYYTYSKKVISEGHFIIYLWLLTPLAKRPEVSLNARNINNVKNL